MFPFVTRFNYRCILCYSSEVAILDVYAHKNDTCVAKYPELFRGKGYYRVVGIATKNKKYGGCLNG